ncbi:hypothetical protein OC842_000076 [Tilletia horrida]|uniref:START domain-containing protein n=1 Tax=Tilletia horrida TaxID=155126 RepID=A0AAN6JN50_9BASI|nr:hypothetical protein OC842_000076 [Tilletia horrida]
MEDDHDRTDDVPAPAAVLRRFLSVVDPELLADLSTSSAEVDNSSSSTAAEDSVALSEWDLLYASHPAALELDPAELVGSSEMRILVRTHPDPNTPLFSIQAFLPNLCARRFWTLMAESENRHLWDATIQNSEVQPFNGQHHDQGDIKSRIEVLTFAAIFMVTKARDMVLLSVDAQLPPRRSESSSSAPLRLLSASQSITHPAFPPRKKFTRFQLGIGGFLVEDLPANPEPSESDSAKGGIIITQLSDLGPAATWLPSSIVKMVASTLVPRSLAKIAECARKMAIPFELLEDGSQENEELAGKEAGAACVTRSVGASGEVWEVGRRLPAQLRRREGATPPTTRSIFLPPAEVAHARRSTQLSETGLASIQSADALPFKLEGLADSGGSPARSSVTPSRIRPLSALLQTSQCRTTDETLSERPDTSTSAPSSEGDEEEDAEAQMNSHLADAIADELDRISLQAAHTLRTFTLATGRRTKRQLLHESLIGTGRGSGNGAARAIPSAFFARPGAGPGVTLEEHDEAAAAVGLKEEKEEHEDREESLRSKKARRRASRALLDSSSVCAMLLAPGLASSSDDGVLTTTTTTPQRAEAKAEAHSLVVDAYRAEVEEEVRRIASSLCDEEDEEDEEGEARWVGNVSRREKGQEGRGATEAAASGSSGDNGTGWWPSFGLLWGVLPMVSWQPHSQ